VSVALVRAVSLIAPPVLTVPVFRVLLAHLATVYQEIHAIKSAEITLKHQVKVVMMETP
jgi:hypothetical protein